MIRIDELIVQLCPKGVEFKELSELLDYEQPGKYLVESIAYDDNHATPVLTAGQTFILGYTDETDGIYPASPKEPVIIFDDFTTAFKWVDFPFKAKSSAMKMLTPKPDTLESLRYAYYAMQTITYTPQDHARQWIGTYSKFRIPVPPLEVQREIVKVLDTFTKLEAELEAELEARRRQYKYYRDALLASKDQKIRWTTMSEVGEFFRGRRFTKDDYVPDGIGCIHYGDIYTQYGTATTATVSQVRSDMSSSLRFAKPGDLVIAGVGETVEDVGKAVAWLGDGEVAIHDDCFVFRHSLNPKFVSYYFQTAAFHAEKNKFVARAKVKRLSAENLGKLAIPVPPLDEQERIVAILDKFDTLVNDLSNGLPAEIKARRQQYEHYRDRLLSFREAA
ncbi:MAG: restriction endonuclease subunit S [Deltaproteobacteria bacterium]|nr:restriction endonuclease subunit S [Deltaproteobacteria bacterium]TLN00963.1 MAG: restriction endonuclease subunit S [bacterium]